MERTITLVTIALLVGCSPEPTVSQFAVRDSVGIEIVESWASMWQDSDGWAVGGSNRLDLAQLGVPPHEFYRVTGATILSNGRIVVANAGSSEIRLFSATGEHLATVGRNGEGPGEYRYIWGLYRLDGDTLGVFSSPAMLTLLSPDLTFLKSFRLGDLVWPPPHPLKDGGWVNVENDPSFRRYEGKAQLVRAPVSLVLRDREGGLLDTLWAGPGFEEWMFPDGDGLSSVTPLLGKQVALATRGSSVLIGTSDQMAYQVLDLDGRIRQVVRVPDYDLTITQASIDAERAALLGSDPSPRWRRIVEDLPAPEAYPAYSEFLVDSEGYLWAGEPEAVQRSDSPRRWEVFSPTGEWMGTVQTPARFRVFEIGVDYVLGVRPDDLDIEHVQVLPLSRTAHRGGGDSDAR